jgi:hypothetical protein
VMSTHICEVDIPGLPIDRTYHTRAIHCVTLWDKSPHRRWMYSNF